MFRRAKHSLVLTCVLVAAVLSALILISDKEPRYEGRTLSEWWLLWSDSQLPPDVSPAVTSQAAQAIRSIGTNALPFLIRGMQREAAYRPARRLPLLLRLLPADTAARTKAARMHREPISQEARGIFTILGDTASPAVPDLTRLLYVTNNPGIVRDAAFCLAAIGEAGTPALIEALRKPQLPARREAALLLAAGRLSDGTAFHFGTNVLAAIAPLSELATNSDSEVAAIAIKALGRLKSEPRVAIPALAKSLTSGDPKIRQSAVRALAEFGAASAIAPALTDKDDRVRRTATNCLALLTAQGLTNAPAP